MVEVLAVALVLLAPALLFIAWLTVMGAVVAAFGASSDRGIDEVRLLNPRPRPS